MIREEDYYNEFLNINRSMDQIILKICYNPDLIKKLPDLENDSALISQRLKELKKGFSVSVNDHERNEIYRSAYWSYQAFIDKISGKIPQLKNWPEYHSIKSVIYQRISIQ